MCGCLYLRTNAHTYTHQYITKPTHTHTTTHYKTHTYTHNHTLQNPHIYTQPHITKPTHTHTTTHYKTHTYTHPHITKSTHAHIHTLQNPHIHTHTLQNQLKQPQYRTHSIRPRITCMLIYQMMVEGAVILRLSSTNGCLVWSWKFLHVKVELCVLWSRETRRTRACCLCCSLFPLFLKNRAVYSWTILFKVVPYVCLLQF